MFFYKPYLPLIVRFDFFFFGFLFILPIYEYLFICELYCYSCIWRVFQNVTAGDKRCQYEGLN